MARRSSETPPRAVIASATRVKLRRGDAGVPLPRREEWQTEAFAFRRDVPEIGFANRYVRNTMSRLIFYVGYRPAGSDPNTPPVPVDAEGSEVPPNVAAAAIAELDRLRSGAPSMSAFTGRFAANVDLVGECYLHGTAATDDKPEKWEIRSISETIRIGDSVGIKDSPSAQPRPVGADDELVRLYVQDEEWSDLATSAMASLTTDCRTLQVLTQQMYAEATSRLSAGFMLVPSEVSPPPVSAPGDDPEEDELLDMILDVTTTPISDAASAASVAPSPWRVASEYIDKIRILTVARQADETLDARAQGRIERIARGLDLPVEVVLGHQQTTFANAQQVDKDTFDDFLAPRCVTLAELLTVGFLTPHLRINPDAAVAGSEWVDRLLVWFDPAPLIASPDPAKNANDGHDRGALSDAAWRRAMGYDEGDAPTAEELVIRLVLKRGIITADIANAILRYYAARSVDAGEDTLADLGLPVTLRPITETLEIPAIRDEDVLLDQTDGAVDDNGPTGAGWGGGTGQDVTSSARPAVSPARTSLTRAVLAAITAPTRDEILARAQQRPNTLGRKLYRIDHDLRSKVHVAASASMERALERAGNRLKAKATSVRAQLKTAPPRLVGAELVKLGRWEEVRALFADANAALFADAWDELSAQVTEWGAAAQAEAINALAEAAAGFTLVERQQLGLRLAATVDEAASWFRGALSALAEARLIDPNVGLLDAGETTSTLSVPFGLVRNLVAALGGNAAILTTTGTDAWLSVPSPLDGGLGVGSEVLAAYRAEGGTIEAYEWQHGWATRPLPAHLALDGKWFVDFEDPVLANSSSFPPTSHLFPGDHAGCTCDFIPVLLGPAQAGDEADTGPAL